MQGLNPFLLQWLITGLSLWVASYVFKGIRFENAQSLAVAALLLGFVNAIVRPALILLTIPLTIVTLGLFLLVINALMIQLVAWMVRGFTVSGFWTALFASIFISLLSFLFSAFFWEGTPGLPPLSGGAWL